MGVIRFLFCFLICTPLFAGELIMVEREGCPYCAHWNKIIAPIYPKTDIGKIYPLKRMDISDNFKQFSLKSPVRYTPTFLIIDKDKEVGRIEGFASEDFFWSRLESISIK